MVNNNFFIEKFKFYLLFEFCVQINVVLLINFDNICKNCLFFFTFFRHFQCYNYYNYTRE